MNRHFGTLFKDFRERKGFKTSEVADGIVSVQFLRKFEKGESDIKLSNFYELLNKINVSFAEFMFEMKSDSTDYVIENFEMQIDRLYIDRNVLGLTRLKANFLNEYKKSGELRHYHYYLVCKTFNNIMTGTEDYSYRDELFDYLNRCETWCTHEYFIADYTCVIFSDKQLYTLAENAFERSIKNRIVRNISVDFVIHAIMELIRRNNFELAKPLIALYKSNENIQPILQFLSYNITLIFLENMIYAKEGCEEAAVECKKIINFYYDTIDYTNYANKMLEYYNTIMNT